MACKNDPKTGAAQSASKTAAPKTAPVPPDGSATFVLTEGTVHWSGKYTMAKGGHKGTIAASGGELWVSQGQILSGTVTLDMNSVSVPDIKNPEDRQMLESHLKNGDFFDTDLFRTATFVFTEVAPGSLPNYNWVLNGELTLKGITTPVSIPFKVRIEGDVLRAESADFTINRTTWGINFNSGILGTAKDKMIEDLVPIRLQVVAKKK